MADVHKTRSNDRSRNGSASAMPRTSITGALRRCVRLTGPRQHQRRRIDGDRARTALDNVANIARIARCNVEEAVRGVRPGRLHRHLVEALLEETVIWTTGPPRPEGVRIPVELHVKGLMGHARAVSDRNPEQASPMIGPSSGFGARRQTRPGPARCAQAGLAGDLPCRPVW